MARVHQLLLLHINSLSAVNGKVPVIRSQCLACGDESDLSRLGLARAAAIFSLHTIWCNPAKHRICASCSSKPLDALKIPTRVTALSLAQLRSQAEILAEVRGLNFQTLDDGELRILTGLTHESIVEVAQESSLPFDQVCQVFVFLRLGLGQRPLSVLFGKTQQTISEQLRKAIIKVSDAMAQKYLRRPRDEILRNKIPFIEPLFPNLLALVDGTYHRCEKSQNFLEQLKSYNYHKGYNLLKTMALFTVDAKWWDLLGLFYSDADHNDEMLLEYIIQNNVGDITSVYKLGTDILMVDRFFSP